MAATKNPLARLAHIRDEIKDITIALRGVEQNRFAENYLLRRAGGAGVADHFGGGQSTA